ncbi:hypothetical protein WBG78_16290 [Chryseolinea sp. T2]|uniref:hypothetical protein n=1 Tax=Chryseolinea sp. T2 TaxID=3129255 RepID=UPI0030789D9F
MSVRINGYAKHPDSIVGKIECLGYYEVKLDAIQKHKLSEFPIEFFGDILLITETGRLDWLNDIGLNRSSFIFYDLASNYFSGQSLKTVDGETRGLMFEPSLMHYAITKLLDKQKVLIISFDSFIQNEIRDRQEIEKLMELKKLVEETIEKQGMIGIVIG